MFYVILKSSAALQHALLTGTRRNGVYEFDTTTPNRDSAEPRQDTAKGPRIRFVVLKYLKNCTIRLAIFMKPPYDD